AGELDRTERSLRLVVLVHLGSGATSADRDHGSRLVFDRLRVRAQCHERALRRQVCGEFLAGLTNCHWHLLASAPSHSRRPLAIPRKRFRAPERGPRVLPGSHSTKSAGDPTAARAGTWALPRTCSA